MKFLNLDRQRCRIKPELDSRMREVFDHGEFILGPEVEELEVILADRVNVKHCVGVSSGTDALLIVLMAIGVGRGDEVLMPGFNYAAAVEVTLLLGAKPVFVDIHRDTYNIDEAAIAGSITARTKAIIVANLFGQCADYDAIKKVIGSRKITVVEDGAQSFGASLHGRPSCSLGDIAITSFFPSKPLGCYGDGGALFTDNDQLALQVQKISRHGQSGKYSHEILGLNARLDTLQAAVLLAKLTCFDDEVARRVEIAERYSKGLSAASDRVKLPHLSSGTTSTFAQYTVEVEQRELVKATLARHGIPSAVHYPLPLYRQPAFIDEACFLPSCELSARRVLSLPSCPYMTDAEQQQVIKCLLKATGASNGQDCALIAEEAG